MDFENIRYYYSSADTKCVPDVSDHVGPYYCPRHPFTASTQPDPGTNGRLYHFSIAGLRSISHVKFVLGCVCNHQ
jgi:hypothetical protein